MTKLEVSNLLEPHLEENTLSTNCTINVITNQGLALPFCEEQSPEFYFLDESVQINTSFATSLISYSQIASITII